MSWLFGGKYKKNLVVEYTKDLNALSIDIKTLESRLSSKRPYIFWFHLYILPLVLSGVYYFYGLNNYIVFVSVLMGYIVINYCIWKFGLWQRQYYTRKISKLRSQYDDKLNKFKQETQFNEANSMLQRFSGGTDQVEVVNEELEGKYTELNKLKFQIDKLKDQDDKNAWFDKVVGIVAGGNDLLVKVVCPQCHKSTGLYRYINEPVDFKCIECGFEIHDEQQSKLKD
ncbi:endoplasmic reticulum junction formation protein lunapark [Monosporozyma servazzii]